MSKDTNNLKETLDTLLQEYQTSANPQPLLKKLKGLARRKYVDLVIFDFLLDLEKTYPHIFTGAINKFPFYYRMGLDTLLYLESPTQQGWVNFKVEIPLEDLIFPLKKGEEVEFPNARISLDTGCDTSTEEFPFTFKLVGEALEDIDYPESLDNCPGKDFRFRVLCSHKKESRLSKLPPGICNHDVFIWKVLCPYPEEGRYRDFECKKTSQEPWLSQDNPLYKGTMPWNHQARYVLSLHFSKDSKWRII